MKLEKQLEQGLNCFYDNNKLPRKINFHSDKAHSELYNTCYFHMKSFNDSIESKEAFLETSKSVSTLPLLNNKVFETALKHDQS